MRRLILFMAAALVLICAWASPAESHCVPSHPQHCPIPTPTPTPTPTPAAVIDVPAWQFHNDGTQAGSTPKAAQNASASVGESEVFILRFLVQSGAGTQDPNNFGYHLAVDLNGNGVFHNVDNSAAGPVEAQLSTSASGIADRSATTNRLTGGTGAFIPGEVDIDGGTIVGVGTAPTPTNFTELAFVVKPAAVRSPGDVVRFRLHNSNTGGVVALRSGVSMPSITLVADSVPPVHPASYYTGPLGQRNILPATAGGALLGVWTGGTGVAAPQAITRLQSLQATAGRKLDVIGSHLAGGGTFVQTQCAYLDNEAVLDWTIQNGSVVYLTWTPDRWTGTTQAPNSKSPVRQVVDGDRDPCIDAMASKLRDKGVRIMLRPFHEFDNHWTYNIGYFKNAAGLNDYSNNEDLGAAALIAAWRRIVTRFQAAGASNVGFYWAPDEGGGSRSFVSKAYPGNAYADWVGSDRYNSASGYSACGVEGWATFDMLFNIEPQPWCNADSFHDVYGVANGKPVFIGETSTRYDANLPSRKNTWYSDIAKAKDPSDARYMSNLVGVSIFDQFVTSEGNSDWRIDSNQTAADQSAGTLGTQNPAYGLDGWTTWANDSRWKVGVAP